MKVAYREIRELLLHILQVKNKEHHQEFKQQPRPQVLELMTHPQHSQLNLLLNGDSVLKLEKVLLKNQFHQVQEIIK